MTRSTDQVNPSRIAAERLVAAAALWVVCNVSFPCVASAQMPVESKAGVATSSQITTLTTNVRRVNLDVVVTDWEGRSVTGLVADDFKVEEDKAAQAVRSFDVHTSAVESASVASHLPALPANTFLNMQAAPEAGTPTVLLYDALNTSLTEQGYARQELLRFVRSRKPGTQIAIFVLGAKLRMLQGFTQDTDLLSAALNSKSAQARGMATQSTSGSPGRTPGGLEGDPQFDQFLFNSMRMDKEMEVQNAKWSWWITVNALTEIGRFLSTVPGRKNLVWFSSVFQSSIFRTDSTRDARVDAARSKAMKQALDLITLSHTAVYPVNVMGVKASLAFAANNTTSFGFDGGAMRRAPMVLMAQNNADQIDMDLIADATGGHAYYGTNDLAEAVGKAIVNGSTYYSLTYEPTNPKYDGSLRHVKVTLTKPGYNLSYRRTYYADDLNAAARAVADAPEGPLTPALERGIPLSQGLIVEAHLEASGGPVAATAEQMRVLSQYGGVRAKAVSGAVSGGAGPVMMQSYLISYGLLARQLEMPVDETGERAASLEVGMISYDEDGRKLNGVDTRIDDRIAEARYAKLVSDGYHVGQSVAVPVGAASVRLAVRDVRGNRVGSLEVRLPLAGDGVARAGETKLTGK